MKTGYVPVYNMDFRSVSSLDFPVLEQKLHIFPFILADILEVCWSRWEQVEKRDLKEI